MTNNYSFDNQTNVLKSSISTNIGDYYQYEDGYMEIGITKNENNNNKLDVFKITMGINHHFKLTIEGLQVNEKMKFDFGNKYGKFLPVESINITPITVTHTNLNIGVFSDLPILSSRKMGRLKITLLDDVDNTYENAVLNWFQSCCYNGFVSPISEIIKEAHYYEYDNKGKESKHYRFWIIPEGDISLNRNYNDNQLKKIDFNTIIVGDIDQIHSGKTLSYTQGIRGTDNLRAIVQGGEPESEPEIPTEPTTLLSTRPNYGGGNDGIPIQYRVPGFGK